MENIVFDIKINLDNVNKVNAITSQYENFVWNFLRYEETTTELKVFVYRKFDLSSSEQDKIIAQTIVAKNNPQSLNTMLYISKLLLEKTLAKNNFIQTSINEHSGLYRLETSTNLYLLTKVGKKFFSQGSNALQLRYFNWDLAGLLFNLKTAGEVVFPDNLLNDDPHRLATKIKEWSAKGQNLSSKLHNIAWFKHYYFEITKTTPELILTYCFKNVEDQTPGHQIVINKNDVFALQDSLKLVYEFYYTNDKIFQFVRTLILDVKNPILNYYRQEDQWKLTAFGFEIFSKITIEKIINPHL
ncbi:hypothetical protein SPE_0586 [Spiroplasma eriocheiris CCTCC M 207170]|nr:hypothetical protein SPE_0586 [Spiroplasma eriocheiris CCTCC M 207170]